MVLMMHDVNTNIIFILKSMSFVFFVNSFVNSFKSVFSSSNPSSRLPTPSVLRSVPVYVCARVQFVSKGPPPAPFPGNHSAQLASPSCTYLGRSARNFVFGTWSLRK
jgi:hypothetical protein